MHSGTIFLMVVIVLVVGVIGCVELLDRRELTRHKRMLKESVRCAGYVQSVERRGILDSRSAYPWNIVVVFEYGGERHAIVKKCMSKPNCSGGERVTVLVDTSDPNRSIVA